MNIAFGHSIVREPLVIDSDFDHVDLHIIHTYSLVHALYITCPKEMPPRAVEKIPWFSAAVRSFEWVGIEVPEDTRHCIFRSI